MGPGRPRNFSIPQKPPKISKSRKTGVKRRQSKKVAQRKRGYDEQNRPENWPVAPSYRQNGFVGWVPNRQNRSPTDETAPSPTPKRPYLGSQGHVGPQTLGPHVACDQIWSAGVSPRADPKTGKIHLWAFLARFGPQAGWQNFSKSPRPPKTSKSRISRKTRLEPPNVFRLRKLRNATAV